MSRTYKDKPWKFKAEESSQYGLKREDQPKKKKNKDTEGRWMGTPSWWTHMFMIRPRRVSENQQLRNIFDIEEFDFIDVKRKNHKYYW
jgi:hypothetical protein